MTTRMKVQNVLLVLAVFRVKVIDCALCGNTFFGENNPDSKTKELESNTDFGYVMSDSNYIVDCCGVVDRWEAYFDSVSGSRTVFLQVWRPVTSGSSTMELVGQNSITVSSSDEHFVNIAQADRITVKSGDKWGWWSDGDDIITYKKGGGEEDNNWMMFLNPLSEGATEDWSAASSQNDRSYAMRMDVQSNNAPSFTNLPDTVNIDASDGIGTSLIDVTFTDIDTYDVSTLSVSMNANSDYSFDGSTSFLILTDRVETASTFTLTAVDELTFKVWDQCSNTATATLTVSITNQPPTITNLPDSESISEDATAATSLFTVTVNDPEGSATTCTLTSTTPAGAPFTVGLTDKIITSDGSPGFDYATTTSYDLAISCTDGQYSDTGTFTVNIIKNVAPVFLNLQNSTSVSTTDTVGTTAFTVLVFDTDDVSFSMTCDPTPCPFTILDSGEIKTTEDLTDHTTVGYDVFITVADARNTVGPRTLTITIADINDAVTISNLPLTLTVMENTVIGTAVFTVSYSDSDTLQAHTFSMASTPSTGLTYFRISSTGEISSLSAIDYETIASKTFALDVTVADPVTSDTKTLTIEIINENEAPSFSQSSYTVSAVEGNAGTVIGTPPFGLTDPDTGDINTLTNDCGSHTGYFTMDSSSGQLTYQSDYDLDTGSLPTTVTCTVTVTDSGGLTDTATLTITITDENDNSPVFSPTSYSFYISYYASVGTAIGSVTATDADTGDNGVITYTLDQTSLSAQYFVISNSGEITALISPLGSPLGYGTSVTITATASDVGARTDTATVVITISDTTTTSTTTTTDRYRNFLEDSKNIAWLSACVALLLVTLGVLAYVILTCHGQNGCAQFKKTLCKGKPKKLRRLRRHNRRKYSMDSFSDDSWSRRVERDNGPSTISTRRPPPDPRMQAWRRDMV